MNYESTVMHALVARFSPGLIVYLSPYADKLLRGGLTEHLPAGARLLEARPGAVLTDPGIVVLTPADLRSADRAPLLSLTQMMTPGRPILLGGTSDRDALLDAINNWRVTRVLPEDCSPIEVLDAVRRAHETLSLDVTLQNAVRELKLESERLESAIADLRSARERLLHTERLTTVGRIADGLIAAIRQHLRALEEFEATMGPECDEELLGTLEAAFEGMRSIGTLLDEIHSYAENREQSYDLTVEELDEVVGRVVGFSRFDTLARGRVVETELMSGAQIRVDRHRIYQVLLNLLRNAFQASPPESPVTVRSLVEDGLAVVEVIDHGTGIPEDVRKRIFEPFFSTKGDHGMGLGLAVSRVAIERQGGSISCESEVGVGTTFRVSLPCA